MRDKTAPRLSRGLLVSTMKENKYHAHSCEYGGERFASYLERDRYIFLLSCQRTGRISNLRRQVRYELFPDEYKDEIVHLKTKDKVVSRRSYIGVFYTADFVYDLRGVTVVEDVKGSRKAMSRDSDLRIKMMHYLKGIDVRLVFKATEDIG